MTPLNRLAALLVTGVLGLTALTACSSSNSPTASSSSSDSPSTSSPSAGSTAASRSATSSDSGTANTTTITIKNFKYTGATSVRAGAPITVKNNDTEAHTVTSDAKGAFDVKINPGESATFAAPAKPGSFPYHCTYHANMHGTLKVS
jgi:plastocyanin